MTTFAQRPATAPATGTTAPVAVETTAARAARYVFAGLRISLGFIFLWAFIDKVFGLGFSTPAKGAWINGASPTKGFLANSAKGPFADFYHSIAGTTWANWLFMAALAGVGVALVLGIGMRIAAVQAFGPWNNWGIALVVCFGIDLLGALGGRNVRTRARTR
jgi:thiosulfate dehydrogenase [quinone] large subunit